MSFIKIEDLVYSLFSIFSKLIGFRDLIRFYLNSFLKFFGRIIIGSGMFFDSEVPIYSSLCEISSHLYAVPRFVNSVRVQHENLILSFHL